MIRIKIITVALLGAVLLSACGDSAKKASGPDNPVTTNEVKPCTWGESSWGSCNW